MATHESKNESLVAKLSDSNYKVCKTEMKWYLRSKGLLEYALGTLTVSADATESEKKNLSRKRRQNYRGYRVTYRT